MTTTLPVLKGTNAPDLVWPGRVLAWEHLRHLNGQGRIVLQVGAVVTPLAADELRARGIELAVHGAASAAGQRRRGVAPRIEPTPWSPVPCRPSDANRW